jgi:hypothetical protein
VCHCVCRVFLFLRTPSRAPDRTPPACAKRATYSDTRTPPPWSPIRNPSLPSRPIPRLYCPGRLRPKFTPTTNSDEEKEKQWWGLLQLGSSGFLRQYYLYPVALFAVHRSHDLRVIPWLSTPIHTYFHCRHPKTGKHQRKI